ncbi:MAG: STAS domain-containing protein [Acidimicrobiia bacterium]
MPEELPIDIAVDKHGIWTRVSVSGDLDMATAPRLLESSAEVDGNLAIDLSGVRFIDSSGLRALFQLNQTAEPVALISPSAVVQRLLSLTDMAQVFAVVDDFSALSDSA